MADQTTTRENFPRTYCTRCSGSGRIDAYSHVVGGICFGCEGVGSAIAKGDPHRIAMAYLAFANPERTRMVRKNGSRYWRVNADSQWTAADLNIVQAALIEAAWEAFDAGRKVA